MSWEWVSSEDVRRLNVRDIVHGKVHGSTASMILYEADVESM